MNKLVCITGLTGSGKSVASDYYVKKGFKSIRFGQIVLDEVRKRGLAPTEEHERPIREEFRKKYGMGAFAKLNLPKFRELLKKGDVLGDGMYSFEEYKVLRDAFGNNLIVIAIYAPPQIRYQRLAKRVLTPEDIDLRHRPATNEAAKSRDFAELENLNKGATIAMADYTVLNIRDLKYLYKQLDEIYTNIQKV